MLLNPFRLHQGAVFSGFLFRNLTRSGATKYFPKAVANPTPASMSTSPDDATCPPTSPLVDDQGRRWTLSASRIYINDVIDAYSGNANLILWHAGAIYHRDTANAWWHYGAIAPYWAAQDHDPRVSADGFAIPADGSSFTDSGLHVWTLTGGVMKRDGNATNSSGAILGLWYGNAIYYENGSGNWYLWNSTTSLFGAVVGDPRATGTIYVATTGNDTTGDGTQAKPYATIAKANGIVTAGRQVIVRGGTYYGVQTLTTSGSLAGGYISYKNYPGETVIFDGTGGAVDAGVFYIRANYVKLDGFTIRNGTTTVKRGVYIENNHHVQILNCIIHDTWQAGILTESTVNVHDITIQGCEVYNACQVNSATPGSVVWPQGICLYSQPYTTPNANMVVTQCNVHECWGEGIGFIGVNGGSCTRNTVWDCFSVMLYNDGAANITWDRNLVYYTGDARFKYTSNGYEPMGIGVSTERSSDGTASCTWSNNIVINGRRGFYSWDNGYTKGIPNCKIVNNTFANSNVAGVQISAEAPNSGIILRNNLSYRSPSGTGGSGTASGVTFDHNCWYGGAGGPFAGGSGDVTSNPALAAPGTRSAVNIDPTGYRLSVGSPCIGAGSNTGAPIVDYFGTTRPVGAAIDIGATEQ